MPALINDQSSFDEAINKSNLTVVHFQADWADQCSQVNEVLDALAKQSDYASVKFYSCPAEELSEVSLKYHIEAVPTVLLFRSNKNIDRVDGADAAKITAVVTLHSNAKDPNRQEDDDDEEEPQQNIQQPESQDQTNALEERLKSLINQHKVMLFMKGDRTTPRCGFSRQMIEILNKTSVSYGTFDILQDEDVRQGLKKYSDWPTYPQLYVDGQLVGGLDIIKEMESGGFLISALTDLK